MTSSKNRMPWFCWPLFCLILFANTCHGFHLLGTHMYKHTFAVGDELFAKVNSLTSLDSQLPFSYYSLPYCKPQMGIKKSETNLGQLLLGDQILNSPYRFQMNVNETGFLCVRDPLTANEVKLLKQRIHNLYQVNMFLDDLPITRFVKQNDGYIFQWTGFPVGYKPSYSNNDYIINHLKFRVLIHEVDDSGFEVVPCSVNHNSNYMSTLHMYENPVQPINCPLELKNSQIIQENETVAFTYEVEFLRSDIKWQSRWDAYSEMGGDKIRFYSILNSVITILILAGIVLAIYMRTVRRELTQYEPLNKEPMNKELPGWKLVVGDVFREPGCAKLLCVMVGDSIRIIGTVLATIVFTATGFKSPVSRGTVLTTLIMVYLLFGIVAGYVSVRLWRTIKATSKGWKSVSWSVTCFFPGLIFVVMAFSNVLLSRAKSTRAIPISLFFILLSLWFCISVPLTLIGGFIGTEAEIFQYPVQTNHVPREIIARKYLSWMLVLGSGILPFGTICIELFLILSGIWLGRFYFNFGFLFIVLLMLILICAIASVILTYTRLRAEDWRWWWKAFFASGSVGIYVFLFSICYLAFDLHGLSGPVSAALYTGYALIMAIGVVLATGSIGFLVAFYSVQRLYSSVKIDC